VIRRYKAAKTSEALESLWQEAVDEGDVAGPFWATLTHPRCTPVLELALCREMHMLQHQAGATTRVERSRFEALMQENATLLRELGKVQERCTRLVTEKTQELERLRQELMQARAALLCRDTTIACLRSDLAEVRETLPELEPRLQLKRKLNAEKPIPRRSSSNWPQLAAKNSAGPRPNSPHHGSTGAKRRPVAERVSVCRATLAPPSPPSRSYRTRPSSA